MQSQRVAVIGAGAAGLVAARELRREGHKVAVFEREGQIGGTWIYSPKVESDPLGVYPSRDVVTSSLYASLRTNLPREIMGFRDYPFVVKSGLQRDARRFPAHWEVRSYLEDFASEFGIGETVRLGTEVWHVGLVENGSWKVKYRKRNYTADAEEIYDAVVVCSGHFTEPRVATFPGIETWSGQQMHSHNYRIPKPFQDKVVVLIGSSASAVDISRDIAGVAKEVHVASRSVEDGVLGKQQGYHNMWLHSMIKSAYKDGAVEFEDGSMVAADVILHCTGYQYHFPFLETNGIVTVDDNRVGPLFKHIFPPVLAPSLSFVGLPFKVMPFPMFEHQSKWIAGVLSGRIMLPSKEDMMEDVDAFYATLQASGVPKRYTHQLGGCQFEYLDWLAAECGIPACEEWRKQMYDAVSKNRKAKPETYRDEWDDEQLVVEAHEDFNDL